MELIMQELLNAGIITMEQVERARMEKIMKALEEYGIETPKITKRKDGKPLYLQYTEKIL